MDLGGIVHTGSGRSPHAVQQVELHPQVGLGCAGIDPVRLGADSVEDTLVRHGREDLAFDRNTPTGFDAIDDRGLEHVGAGVYPVTGGRASRRLLDEARDPSVRVGGYDAVARGVVDGRQRDRCLGPRRPMEQDQLIDGEVGEHIAVEYEERLVDPGVLGGESDGPGGVERLGLDGVVEGDSGAATVGIGVAERVGQEAEREHHLFDAVGGEVSDHVLDHGPVHDRQHLLREIRCERAQPRPEAPDQYHGAHGARPIRRWSSERPVSPR